MTATIAAAPHAASPLLAIVGLLRDLDWAVSCATQPKK